MKKVLITGASGQLGSALIPILSHDYLLYPFGRKQLDITNERLLTDTVLEIKPDVIIHCAAYTNVDEAESHVERAFEVNAIGSQNVAIAANHVNSKLVYISTNYVFDGVKESPYTEEDLPNPINAYGKSKLAGEQYVQKLATQSFIIRTSWLFGGNHKNFVTMMQGLGERNDSLSIVYDQIGNPTYTVDLANKLMEIFETEKYGIYHVTNRGTCSWFEFAQEIFRLSNLSVEVVPVTTEAYNAPAPRPKNSAMVTNHLNLNHLQEMQDWQQALREYVQQKALWKVN